MTPLPAAALAPALACPARRGFTMLELVLAVSLGAIVVLVTMGIFVQIERTDTLLARRAEQSNDLNNLHLVAQRAISTLVMSTEAQPPRPRTGDTSDNNRSRFRTTRDPDAPLPIPRLILEPDVRARGMGMNNLGNADFRAEGTAIQRLEVVLSDSPVPQTNIDLFARAGISALDIENRGYIRGNISDKRSAAARGDTSGGTGGSGSASGPAHGSSPGSGRSASAYESYRKALSSNTSDAGKNSLTSASAAGSKNASSANSSDPNSANPASADSATGDATSGDSAESVSVRAIRGAFELRPQPLTREQYRQLVSEGIDPETAPPRAWQMWWVPLPPRTNGSTAPSLSDAATAGEPFLIASNLKYAKWTMFDDGIEKTDMTATWEQNLPAHVTLDVMTTAGLTAKWMLEVDWGRGPEVPPQPVDFGPKRADPVPPGTPDTPGSPRTPTNFPRGATSKTSTPASKSGGKP